MQLSIKEKGNQELGRYVPTTTYSSIHSCWIEFGSIYTLKLRQIMIIRGRATFFRKQIKRMNEIWENMHGE
jgi:hypothetical protein